MKRVLRAEVSAEYASSCRPTTSERMTRQYGPRRKAGLGLRLAGALSSSRPRLRSRWRIRSSSLGVHLNLTLRLCHRHSRHKSGVSHSIAAGLANRVARIIPGGHLLHATRSLRRPLQGHGFKISRPINDDWKTSLFHGHGDETFELRAVRGSPKIPRSPAISSRAGNIR